VKLSRAEISLAYHEEGPRDGDPLLLLHGLNAHSGTWRKNVGAFSRTNRVIAPSLPTWRGSLRDLNPRPYAEVLEEFLQVDEIDRVSVVGNSMGGWIGLALAERNQDLIDVLILEDSAGVSFIDFEKINSIGIPVLIIWGGDDKTFPIRVAEHFHHKIDSSTLIIFNEAGHVPHWEKPDEFNRVVLDFITKMRERGSK